MDLVKALKSLRPNALWSLDGDDYSGLVWLDNNQSKPRYEELIAECSRLSDIYNTTEYRRLREKEYPPMADYLDAVYWQTQGDNTKMQAYLTAVEQVKLKYPKD
jgi:hypothetical protein